MGASPWEFDSPLVDHARVAELVDALGSEPSDPKGSCEFDARPEHHSMRRWLELVDTLVSKTSAPRGA